MRPNVNLALPRVSIPEKVWKQLLAYIDACPKEVGGLGRVERKDGSMVVTELFLIEQSVTEASMDFDASGFARFIAEWAVKPGNDPSALTFWWHSHASFGVGWSGIDLATMELLTASAEGPGYLISFVGNHRREKRVRLTVSRPVPIVVDDLPIEVVPDFDQALVEATLKEVAAKVRTKRRWPWQHNGLSPAPEETFIAADLEIDPAKGELP